MFGLTSSEIAGAIWRSCAIAGIMHSPPSIPVSFLKHFWTSCWQIVTNLAGLLLGVLLPKVPLSPQSTSVWPRKGDSRFIMIYPQLDPEFSGSFFTIPGLSSLFSLSGCLWHSAGIPPSRSQDPPPNAQSTSSLDLGVAVLLEIMEGKPGKTWELFGDSKEKVTIFLLSSWCYQEFSGVRTLDLSFPCKHLLQGHLLCRYSSIMLCCMILCIYLYKGFPLPIYWTADHDSVQTYILW